MEHSDSSNADRIHSLADRKFHFKYINQIMLFIRHFPFPKQAELPSNVLLNVTGDLQYRTTQLPVDSGTS